MTKQLMTRRDPDLPRKSRWSKPNERYPKQEAAALSKFREQSGWRNGARVRVR